MNTQKTFTYIALTLGIVGLILQVIILNRGDDVIKLNALSGDYGVVSTMVTLALLVLAITVILTLVFSFGNLASDGKKLKKSIDFNWCICSCCSCCIFIFLRIGNAA